MKKVKVGERVIGEGNLMEKADLAISVAGSTLYELANCGVPTIAIKITDNQFLLVRELKKQGIVISLYSNYNNLRKDLTKDTMLLINDRDRRREMANKTINLTDSKSAHRIIR